MRPTSKDLAMRDRALAAAMGVLPGSDFGGEFGGFGFGEDMYGADVPAPHPSAVAQLHPVHRAMLAKASQTAQITARRKAILDPNEGSDAKVERYAFSLNQAITLGTALSGFTMSNNPAVRFRPQQLTINAPSPGFVTISTIFVANVAVTVGATGDAFEYNANSQNSHLDMPTLDPANKAQIQGSYTGLVPSGFPSPLAYTLVATFKGPASIVA